MKDEEEYEFVLRRIDQLISVKEASRDMVSKIAVLRQKQELGMMMTWKEISCNSQLTVMGKGSGPMKWQYEKSRFVENTIEKQQICASIYSTSTSFGWNDFHPKLLESATNRNSRETEYFEIQSSLQRRARKSNTTSSGEHTILNGRHFIYFNCLTVLIDMTRTIMKSWVIPIDNAKMNYNQCISRGSQ